jgi:3-keto-5-aminohexanoate cleavage enzyme
MALIPGMAMTPLIIEAALNGTTSKARNPNTPKTAEEITDDALACLAAGAAIIHTHIGGYQTSGDAAVEEYVRGWAPVLGERPDAILYGTIANGRTPEQRFGHYRALAEAGMRMATLDPGSLNLATQGEDGLPGSESFVYRTSFADIAALIELLAQNRLGPSIGIYEPGFLRATLAYEKAGRLPPGALVKIYFAGPYNFLDGRRSGMTFGLSPTRKALDAYLEMMDGSALPWAVAVLGGCVADSGLARAAIEHGGHVRVGLEDYCGEDLPSNADLITEIVEISRTSGRPIATPDQAAHILRLPR